MLLLPHYLHLDWGQRGRSGRRAAQLIIKMQTMQIKILARSYWRYLRLRIQFNSTSRFAAAVQKQFSHSPLICPFPLLTNDQKLFPLLSILSRTGERKRQALMTSLTWCTHMCGLFILCLFQETPIYHGIYVLSPGEASASRLSLCVFVCGMCCSQRPM